MKRIVLRRGLTAATSLLSIAVLALYVAGADSPSVAYAFHVTHAPGQAGTVVFYGSVTGPSGPVAGANVRFTSPHGGRPATEVTRTDAQGLYRVDRPVWAHQSAGTGASGRPSDGSIYWVCLTSPVLGDSNPACTTVTVVVGDSYDVSVSITAEHTYFFVPISSY